MIILPPILLRDKESITLSVHENAVRVELRNYDQRPLWARVSVALELVRDKPEAAASLIRSDLDKSIELLRSKNIP
jgi:hypothetical protein